MARHPNISDLRDRIDIIGERITTVDGAQRRAEVVLRRVAAHIRPVTSGQEQYFADQTEGINTFVVTIRWPVGVDVTNAKRLRNEYRVHGTTYTREFDIKRVVDRDNRHQWLDIRVEEKGSEQS